ncbi:Sec-independent protein translocase protein TatCy [Polaribacter huanghezhanensis]|uniref:twin-arginine translocase subunit TatC n=1 Tax=Polaribacter huanghezhanensis TaxID=1354726 RepID=UPI00264943BD|nr:twin-arginine translocase subunit TatC [Polaribacter huanghezhanensis]WKD86524.1 Sec-independent protein translocase protein TatCy [Polaribacter huanghezhanensis]
MSDEPKEMSFLGHLEELRWHLVRSSAVIFVFAIVLFIFREEVYNDFIIAHTHSDFVTYKFFCKVFGSIGIDSSFCDIQIPSKLQALSLTQQLMSSLWVSFILGIILAFPYLLWELWRFISPGLHKTERRKSRGFLFIASFLFFIGVAFSYYVIMPMSVSFFYGYQISENIVNNFTLDSYISLFTNTMIGISLVFELPVVIYFLSKLGLVTPSFLRKYRKHALVLVLILSAIITPPDVASQIIVSIPILILYEISIYISGFVLKRQLKNAK